MSLKIPLPTASDINRLTYRGAAKLKEEMTRPGGQPDRLDFSVMATCFHCTGSMPKPLLCSGCKSTVYCSKKCQVANWKVGQFGTDGHKSLCEKNKRHMQKVPQVQAILKLFPWGKLESDGIFAEPFIRAYYGVLGAEGFGYWSEAGGTTPHQDQPTMRGARPSPFHVNAAEGYQDGYLLLLDQHLDEKAGWKLEDRLIPKLHFGSESEPLIASSANVVDWKSWHQWRGLPLESPASLLMHYPLTVYHLLVDVLKVTGPTRNSPTKRQRLNVHYLGAEVELNMLPLFSELALLLPYTDIKLTFFGYAVHNIVRQASKKSVVAKAKRNEPVYTYRSPASMGESTIAIHLHGEHENWDPRFVSVTNDLPDAIVGLNAGLLSYEGWPSVILFCHVEDMPFGVTEYAEQSAEVQRDSFPKIINHALPSLAPRMGTAQIEELVRPRQYPIAFNPFQRPGQRTVGMTRLPNVPNGFTMRVVGRDSVDEVEKKVGSLAADHPAVDVFHVETAEKPEQVQQLIDKTRDMSLNGLD